jgi:signal peptidase
LSAIATATLVLTAAAVLAVVAIGPHVFGYRTSTMLGASMAPGIERGDLVVSVPVRAAEVAVGDVITYRSPVEAGRYETRRVVSVGRDAAGRVSLVTRADASDTVDPWVVTAEGGTVWRSTHVVRHLGEVVGVLSAPLQQTWALWGVLGLALLMGLRGIGTTGKERTDV